jgi:hypothetical protein
MQNTTISDTENHGKNAFAGWFIKVIFEKSLIPSSTKFDNPNNMALVGDCRCCVDAKRHRSTADEIPEAESKIKMR